MLHKLVSSQYYVSHGVPNAKYPAKGAQDEREVPVMKPSRNTNDQEADNLHETDMIRCTHLCRRVKPIGP